MKLHLIGSATILFATLASAQTYSYTPDKSYGTTEGPYYSNLLGTYSNQRYQFIDGTFRNSAMTIKAMSFRTDFRRYFSYSGPGRKWTNVKIQVAQADYATTNATFSTNAVSTPTQVFSSAVAWATPAEIPTTNLDPWSLQFNFTTPFVHTGTKDFVVDYAFSGGTLDNGGTWTSTTKRSYYLDSYRYGSYSYPGYCYIGAYSSNGGCVDSGASSTYGAYMRSYVYAYGPNYGTTSYRNKFRTYTNGSYFGPNASVITALGFSANPTGVTWPGITCNKLHINTAIPFFTFGVTASSSGSLANNYLGLPNGFSPYNANYVGVPLVFQSIWGDTKTGALKLSSANWSHLPALPFIDSYLKVGLRAVSATSTTAAAGSFYTGSSYYIMIARYTN